MFVIIIKISLILKITIKQIKKNIIIKNKKRHNHKIPKKAHKIITIISKHLQKLVKITIQDIQLTIPINLINKKIKRITSNPDRINNQINPINPIHKPPTNLHTLHQVKSNPHPPATTLTVPHTNTPTAATQALRIVAAFEDHPIN